MTWALVAIAVLALVAALVWWRRRRREYPVVPLVELTDLRDAPPEHVNCRCLAIQLPTLPTLPCPGVPALPDFGFTIEEAIADMVLGPLAELDFIDTLEVPSGAPVSSVPSVARRMLPEVQHLVLRAEILLAGAGDEPGDDTLVFSLYSKKTPRGPCTSAQDGGMYGPQRKGHQE